MIPGLRIQTKSRFIQEHDLWFMQQGTSYFEPPFHAPRKTLHKVTLAIPELNKS